MIQKLLRWRASHRKLSVIILLGVCIVPILILLVMVVVLPRNGGTNSPTETGSRRSHEAHVEDIHSYADTIKLSETYSAVPETKKDEFVRTEAGRLGLDTTTTSEVTPDKLKWACIDTNMTRFIRDMQHELGDDIDSYQKYLQHGLMAIRETCYVNYDPDGKMLPEEMPTMQAH